MYPNIRVEKLLANIKHKKNQEWGKYFFTALYNFSCHYLYNKNKPKEKKWGFLNIPHDSVACCSARFLLSSFPVQLNQSVTLL